MNDLTWQAAAAANILEARKKKGRIGSRKSRTGCNTCKIRRVKCDEGHLTTGSCLKCTSAGRRCDYTNVAPIKANKKGTNSLIGRQLSQSLGLMERDRRTFEYFLSWAAPRLGGPLDKDFWCGQVLQVAQSEPIVLDALLAISILYEHPQFMKSFYPELAISSTESSPSPDVGADPAFQNGVAQIAHPAISRPPIDLYHADALMHYNRAMRTIAKRVAGNDMPPLLALLTCVLFICIEIIRDHVFGALVLFTQGTKLLREYQPVSSVDKKLYTNLKLMFARLGLLAAIFGHSESVDVHGELAYVDKKRGFASITDARTSMYALTTEAHQCIRDAGPHVVGPECYQGPTDFVKEKVEATQHRDEPVTELYRAWPSGASRLFYGCNDQATEAPPLSPTAEFSARSPFLMPWYEIPQEILDRQKDILSRLREWYDAFELSECNLPEDEASATLLMHYHLFTTWLASCLSPYESAHDQFTSQHEEILRLAQIVIKCKAERANFTMEAGVIPHLYCVALKCRVPSIRRRAIELIKKAPKKEAMYSSSSVAEFASRIVSIEEEDMHLSPSPPGPPGSASSMSPPIDDSVLPSEEKRIHSLEILQNRIIGRFAIRVTRHAYDTYTGQRIKTVVDYPF